VGLVLLGGRSGRWWYAVVRGSRPLPNVHPRPGQTQDTRAWPTDVPPPTTTHVPPWSARH